MNTNQALVKTNGNGLAVTAQPAPKQTTTQVPPLTEALVDEILAGRDLHGWLRAARVARVLGLFSLYLFLDTYDIRADFNRRVIKRYRDQARERGFAARTSARLRIFLFWSFDVIIRVLRYVVFRGAEGSARKEARLHKQAIWLRDSLIDLGPTFIKIGQALGTRADLLPLAYVKELATLQDPVSY